MKRIFVDTGAWYALIDRDDPDHAAVVTCFREMALPLLTSNFVFEETLTLLRYRLGWEIAHRFGEQLHAGHSASMARINGQDEENAWKICTRYRDKSFSYTDCTSFVLMKRMRVDTALAIDNDFRAYGLHCLSLL